MPILGRRLAVIWQAYNFAGSVGLVSITVLDCRNRDWFRNATGQIRPTRQHSWSPTRCHLLVGLRCPGNLCLNGVQDAVSDENGNVRPEDVESTCSSGRALSRLFDKTLPGAASAGVAEFSKPLDYEVLSPFKVACL